MANVAVYIIHTDDKRTERVINIFKSDLFLINEIEIDQPQTFEINLENKEATFEFYKFQKCLLDSYTKYPNTPVLVIKDTSITSATPEVVTDVVNSALRRDDWDVFYLYKYMDLCGQHNKQSDVPETMIKIAKTTSPYGTQALMFTPEGRDMILGKLKLRKGGEFRIPSNSDFNITLNHCIEEGDLFAITSNPNLITIDTLTFLDNEDYGKLSECRIQDRLVIVQENGNYPPWIFLAGSGMLIALIIVSILFLSQRKDGDKIVPLPGTLKFDSNSSFSKGIKQ